MGTRYIILTLTGFLLAAQVFSQKSELIFTHLTMNDGLSDNSVEDIIKDQYGIMWFGTRNGLDRYDGDRFTTYRFSPNDPTSISNNRINSLIIDAEGSLWAYTYDEAFNKYDRLSDSFKRFSEDLVPAEVKSELMLTNELKYRRQKVKDLDGRYWKIIRKGISQCDEDDNPILNIEYRPFATFGISDDEVTRIFIDENNIMWLATRNGGIDKADLNRKPFIHLYKNPYEKGGLLDNVVEAVTVDAKGLVWIATDSHGLCIYDPIEKTYEYIYETGDASGLLTNRTKRLFFDRQGDLWIGSSNKGGLSRMKKDTRLFTHYRKGKGSRKLSSDRVTSMIEDAQSNIWAGTYEGLSIWERSSDRFVHYLPDDRLGIPEKITDVFSDIHGGIWLCSETGLTKVISPPNGDIRKLKFKHYSKEKHHENGLLSNYFFHGFGASDGTLWLGSNVGLYQLDVSSERFRYFGLEDGMVDTKIFAVIEDDRKAIWMSHNRGLSKLDPKTKRFHHYTLSDGLQGYEYGGRAVWKDATGTIYFGGSNGLNYFDPSAINESSRVGEVFFTELKIMNKVVKPFEKIGGHIVLDKNFSSTESIDLNYRHKTFSIGFVSSLYGDTKNNKFAYRLLGFEEEWNYVSSSERRATYSNLPGGSYTFQVKAANPDGIWMETPRELHIRMLPPVWTTWWFRLAVLLSVGTVVAVLFRRRTNTLIRNEERLKREVNQATAEVTERNKDLEVQMSSLRLAISDIKYIIEEGVSSGNFQARIKTQDKEGEWKELGEGINMLFDVISEPLNELDRVMKKLALGNLTERYNIASKGDIARLAENFNSSLDSLSQLLVGVSQKIIVINDSTTDMRLASDEMKRSTSEIASAIAEMSNGAHFQVTHVDKSSALLESVKSSAERIKEQALYIQKSATEGVAESSKGRELTQHVDANMKAISAASKQSTTSIEELVQKAEEINTVLRIIKDIASQTNLLALNAGIEAAQAGEAGRGFSVVAEEIRRLAEGSKKSVKEIEELVQKNQTATHHTADLIRKMGDSIEEAEEATQASNTTFLNIAKSYEETLGKTNEIERSTAKQTEDMTQAVELIAKVVVIAEETAAGSEQMATSSSELSSGMEGYSLKIQQVSDIIERLGQSIEQFELSQELEERST